MEIIILHRNNYYIFQAEKKLLKKIFFCIFTCVFCLQVCMCTTCVQYLWRPEVGVQVSATGVTGGCELPCGCWELSTDPLQDQPVLLTTESPCLPCVCKSYLKNSYATYIAFLEPKCNWVWIWWGRGTWVWAPATRTFSAPVASSLKQGNSTELLNMVSFVIGKLQGTVQKTQPFPGQVYDACLGGNSAACPH